ncbi:unnamed protein product [Prunus brigantina]
MIAILMGGLVTRWGSGGVVCVLRDGLSDGLFMLWKQGLSVQLISSSVRHIDVWVTFPTSQVTKVIGFYSHPDPGQHRHSWELLQHLSYITTALWLCCGDFNEVLSVDEKSGNIPCSKSHIEDFKCAVLDCQLLSFNFVGHPFTWTNNRRNKHNLCLNVLNGCDNVISYNYTLIALISKIASPTRVTEYHPISLCNVLYKIISKPVANILKKALSYVISKFQSAFIPDRMILDNVLVAFETIHCLKRRGKAGRRKLVLKLDMAKAYHWVKWPFLDHMMRTMEFPARFVNFDYGLILP